MKLFKNTLLVLILAFFAGSQISSSAPETPNSLEFKLFSAVLSGDVSTVKTHIAAGAKVGNQYMGSTCLIKAAEMGHAEIVKILINAGANINDRDEFRDTALISAAAGGHAEIVKILIDAGANVNDRDAFRKTARRRAAERRDVFSRIAGMSKKVEMRYTETVNILTIAGGTD